MSRGPGLFGFSESGYRTAIAFAIVAEAATILLLVPVVAVSLSRAFQYRNDANDRHLRGRVARPHYGAGK